MKKESHNKDAREYTVLAVGLGELLPKDAVMANSPIAEYKKNTAMAALIKTICEAVYSLNNGADMPDELSIAAIFRAGMVDSTTKDFFGDKMVPPDSFLGENGAIFFILQGKDAVKRTVQMVESLPFPKSTLHASPTKEEAHRELRIIRNVNAPGWLRFGPWNINPTPKPPAFSAPSLMA